MTLRREVMRALVADGFHRGERVHTKRIDDDFSYLVDTGAINKKLDIVPFVGIRSDRVERLMTELRDLQTYDYVATVSANVGYVVDGAFRSWMPPATAEEVLAAIHAGLDRLGGYLSLDRLPQAWQDIPEAAADPSCDYRRVVVRLLLADRPRVLSELRTAEKTYCRRDDEICAHFRVFQQRVLDRVEN